MNKFLKISIWYMFVMIVALFLAYQEGVEIPGLLVGAITGAVLVALGFLIAIARGLWIDRKSKK